MFANGHAIVYVDNYIQTKVDIDCIIGSQKQKESNV